MTATTFTTPRLKAATPSAFGNGGRDVANQPSACATTTAMKASVAYAVATSAAVLESMSAVYTGMMT